MTPRRRASIAVGALLVLAGCGYGVQSLLSLVASSRATCMNAGATVVMHEGQAGECVGITDGSFQFVPGNLQLVRVLNLIRAENQNVSQRATNGAPYVSIAYLMSISTDGDGVEPVSTVIKQLDGAYAAQHYVNRNYVQGSRPLIKLLVASSGTQAAEWPTAVKEIEQATVSQHLVAVAGIGISLDSTYREVTSLAKAGIPVIGSSLTGDNFSNIPNVVRVSPSNSADVSALLSFIEPKYRTAFLIEDTDLADSYVTTLADGFKAGFPTKQILGTRAYSSAGEVSPTGATAQTNLAVIPQMTTQICVSKASVVLFAGRSRDLTTLLDALASRPCLNQPITVVTGADVINLAFNAGIQKALESGVSLYYAGEANPREWDNAGGTPSQRTFSEFSSTFGRRFPQALEEDGNAMTAYDAVLTGSTAARLVASHPSAQAVATELDELQGTSTVYGTSGPIAFNTIYGKGHQGSNPVNKPVPILRVLSNGQIKFVHLETPPFR